MLRQFTAGMEHLEADLALVADRTDGLTGAHLRELVVGAFTCALEEAGDAARAGTASVMTGHFLQALERLERRVDGPDRWRTVWRVSSR